MVCCLETGTFLKFVSCHLTFLLATSQEFMFDARLAHRARPIPLSCNGGPDQDAMTGQMKILLDRVRRCGPCVGEEGS